MHPLLIFSLLSSTLVTAAPINYSSGISISSEQRTIDKIHPILHKRVDFGAAAVGLKTTIEESHNIVQSASKLTEKSSTFTETQHTGFYTLRETVVSLFRKKLDNLNAQRAYVKSELTKIESAHVLEKNTFLDAQEIVENLLKSPLIEDSFRARTLKTLETRRQKILADEAHISVVRSELEKLDKSYQTTSAEFNELAIEHGSHAASTSKITASESTFEDASVAGLEKFKMAREDHVAANVNALSDAAKARAAKEVTDAIANADEETRFANDAAERAKNFAQIKEEFRDIGSDLDIAAEQVAAEKLAAERELAEKAASAEKLAAKQNTAKKAAAVKAAIKLEAENTKHADDEARIAKALERVAERVAAKKLEAEKAAAKQASAERAAAAVKAAIKLATEKGVLAKSIADEEARVAKLASEAQATAGEQARVAKLASEGQATADEQARVAKLAIEAQATAGEQARVAKLASDAQATADEQARVAKAASDAHATADEQARVAKAALDQAKKATGELAAKQLAVEQARLAKAATEVKVIADEEAKLANAVAESSSQTPLGEMNVISPSFLDTTPSVSEPIKESAHTINIVHIVHDPVSNPAASQSRDEQQVLKIAAGGVVIGSVGTVLVTR